jgi:DNA-binding PadR family transcriptional regulator
MVLLSLARGCRYGFDIMEDTGLASGTIYPALERLEDLGFATSEWEDASVAQQEKRPPRRYYEITPVGERKLAEALDRYRSLAPVELPSGMERRVP